MTASVPVGQALAQAQEIKRLDSILARYVIAHDRADGALADAATVPTGDLERGIRALTAERDGLQAEVERVHHNERAFKEQYHKTISDQRERLAHFERSVIDIKVGLRKRIEEERARAASAEADVKALAEALTQIMPYAEHSFSCPGATSAFTQDILDAVSLARAALARARNHDAS